MSAGAAPRRPTALVVIASLLLLGATLAIPVDDGDDATGGSSAATAPTEWDERLAPYVEIVADERGLAWEHPVAAEFLDEDAFRARVTSSEEPSEEEAKELDQLEGVLRALGLVEGDIDLREVTDRAIAEGVLGFYDPDGEVIVVRGADITDEMAPVIVHELTHALQAQHFDLSPEHETSGESLAYRTLVEADATRVQQAYVRSLSAAAQQAYLDAQVAQAEGQDLEDVPPFLTELLGFPYALGPPWIDAVIAERGDDAVDELFEDPPASEEHIAVPSSFLDDDAVIDVDTPELGAGEARFGEPDDFGMISLLLVLGERLPWADAWPAVEGWAGDASVTFRADERDCIRVHVAMDGSRQATRLGDGIAAWIDGRDHAEVDVDGDLVRFQSCDPGTDAASSRSTDEPRAFEVLSLRAALAPVLSSGVGADLGECVADHLLLVDPGPARTLELATTSDPTSPAAAEIQGLVAAAFAACDG